MQPEPVIATGRIVWFVIAHGNFEAIEGYEPGLHTIRVLAADTLEADDITIGRDVLVTNASKVGIRTDNPQAKLDVGCHPSGADVSA